MDLPKSIVKEFAKQAVEKKPTVDKPTQLVGTVHVEDGQTFVYLDGSNGSKTPVSETVAYQSGDRVLVSIQNRKATIIGNYTDPSINQALDNVIIEYALSSSSVSFIAWPGEKGEWNTIAPEKENGSYMWQRTTKISTNPLVNPEISLTCIQGSDGENGYTPYIGSNGNWWINGVDTGYSAEGDDGHSPYVDTTTNTWWEWDADIGGYHDTGIVPQGPGVFKSIVFKRFSSQPSTPTGGSYLSPVPSGWSDGIPSGTEQIWISTRVFTSDGESPQTSEWTTPQMTSDTPDIDFEYSWIVTNPGNPTDNPGNWSNAATENSIWMAVRKKSRGTWGSWEISKIKGEMSAEQLAQLNQASEDASQAKSDVANLEIGGRNLLLDSSFTDVNKWFLYAADYPENVALTHSADGGKIEVIETRDDPLSAYFFVNFGNNYAQLSTEFRKHIQGGVWLTISGDVKINFDTDGQDNLNFDFRPIDNYAIKRRVQAYFPQNMPKNTWVRIKGSAYVDEITDVTIGKNVLSIGLISDAGRTVGSVVEYRNIKLEIGNKATDWTPAPEDVDIDNLEIGGRNLFIETDYENIKTQGYLDARGWYQMNNIKNLIVYDNSEKAAKIAGDSWDVAQYVNVEAGETYTMSCFARLETERSGAKLKFRTDVLRVVNYNFDKDLTTDYQKLTYTWTCEVGGIERIHIRTGNANDVMYVKKIKFEKGNKATDWTPAPEDVQAEIDSIKKRVVIGDDSVDIVDNTGRLLASYGDAKIELGKNAVSSIIEMCGGMARVSARYGGLTSLHSNNGSLNTTLDYDFNETTFKSKVGSNYGSYEFIYSGGVWECSYSGNSAGYVQVNLSDYGITLKTTSVNEYAGITINYWNGSEATFINAETTKPSRKLILGLAESGTTDNTDYANFEIERSKESDGEHSKINLLTVHDGANFAGVHLDNGDIELNSSGAVRINQYNIVQLLLDVLCGADMETLTVTAGTFNNNGCTAILAGNTLHLHLDAKAKSAITAGNIKNQTMLTITFTDSRISSLYPISSSGGEAGPNSQIQFNTSSSGGQHTITVKLAAIAQNLASGGIISADVALPCLLNFDAY